MRGYKKPLNTGAVRQGRRSLELNNGADASLIQSERDMETVRTLLTCGFYALRCGSFAAIIHFNLCMG